MPNNPDPILILINLSLQQLIVVIANIPPTIDAPTFADPVGEFFQVLKLEFSVKNSEKFYNLPPFFGRRMKPSRCCTGGFSSLKRILRASQTWKLPIGIFVHWKILRHSMHKFCNRFCRI
jgi:hypothetical protein